jgi:DNA polymerase III subunit delta'
MYGILGHERAIAFLEGAASDDRVAHAYLFTGVEGIGKRMAALRFAARLNCPLHPEDLQQTCPSCRRILQGNHPDVVVEKPEKGRIRIDKIRELQLFLAYAPIEGRCRVVIIDDAHRMNPAAQNALLKTLEEPPPARMIVLVSSNPSLLLPTVLSRCRRVRFAPLQPSVVADYMRREKGLDPERATAIAGMSGGSLARALELDTEKFLSLRNRIAWALVDPVKEGIRGLLALSAAMSASDEVALLATDLAAALVRDLLLYRIGYDQQEPLHKDILDALAPEMQHFHEDDLMSVYNEICQAAELVRLPMNINKNLVMDVMLLRIARIMAGPNWGVAVHDPSAS